MDHNFMMTLPIIFCLSNGIPVIMDNVDSLTCSISVNLGIGTQNESRDEYGISHFLEHMLGQGTHTHSSFSLLNRRLESCGAILDIRTSLDDISFSGTVLAENLNALIETIADELQNSLFDDSVIENEKKVILDEQRRYVNVNSWWLFKAKKLLGAHNILGTPETIQSFARQHLLDYYHRHLSADNMLIVISGKISNKETLKKQLEQLFSWIPKQDVKKASTNITPTIAHDFINGAKNQKITFAWADSIESSVANRDRKAAMGLFRKILQNRLMQAVREQSGLSYSIQCSTMEWAGAKLHTINSETLPQNIGRLIANTANVCRNIVSDTPITADELLSAQMVVKLQNAQIMEFGAKRCALYANYFRKYKAIYNVSTETNRINNLVLGDIIIAGQDFFATPISILTQGPVLECDVTDTWNKHFVV